MYFYIKQRIFSFGDQYDIYDENQNIKYFANGKIFTFGAKITLVDEYSNERAYIKQELFHLMPHYEIYMGGEVVAQIAQKFMFFGSSFKIKTSTEDYTLEGEIFNYNFYLEKNGKKVMTIQKQWLSWGDTYEIFIDESENEVLMLSILITLDNAIHGNKNQ